MRAVTLVASGGTARLLLAGAFCQKPEGGNPAVRSALSWRKGSASKEAQSHPLFPDALPGGHRLADGRFVTLSDLAQEPFSGYAATAVPGLNAMVMLAFQQSLKRYGVHSVV